MYHPRLPLLATLCRWQCLREADSLPYGRKGKPLHRRGRYHLPAGGTNVSSRLPPGNTVSHIHRSKKPPLPKGGVGGDSVSLPRQHRVKGDLFRTPREGSPSGQTDKPHTVGRGLAPAETFGDSLQAERLTKSRRGRTAFACFALPMRCCSILCKRQPPCPLRPCGAPPPRGGGVYMGRFVNRPYRNYSLFISEAASLFNIHSSRVSSRLPLPATLCRWQRLREADSLPYGCKGKPLHRRGRYHLPAGGTNVSSRLPLPAIPCRWQRLRANAVRPYLPNALLFDTAPKAAFAKSPPCLKGGGGDSVSLPRQHCAKGRLHLIHTLRAPSAPAGHLPREGEVYMGRLLNRPYRNIHSFPLRP